MGTAIQGEVSATRAFWYRLALWWRSGVSTDAKIVLAAAAAMVVLVYLGTAWNGSSDTVLVSRPSTPAVTRDLEFADRFDATLRNQSILYARWKELNPQEALDYEHYADAIRRGLTPTPPAMRTPLGRALVAATSLGAESRAP